MLGRILVASGVGAIMIAPLFLYAQSAQESYRYNRITAEYTVNRDGSVDVAELFTMFYDGLFRSSWRIIPNTTSSSASTTATDIVVYDGLTGLALTRSDEPLDSGNPEDWGKYRSYEQSDGTVVEWAYDTSNIVHTWVVRYTLYNALTADPDGVVNFSHDIFSDFVAPVDTVEAQVNLPRGIANATATIRTTNQHGSYVDRPTERSFRFRVSDIEVGETVTIDVGWKKEESTLVSTVVDALTSNFLPLKDYFIGALLGFLVFAGTASVLKRRRS